MREDEPRFIKGLNPERFAANTWEVAPLKLIRSVNLLTPQQEADNRANAETMELARQAADEARMAAMFEDEK